MKKIFSIIGWGVACLLSIYALLWVFSFQRYDVSWGLSFNQNHAISLGLDWQDVYTAMLSDIQPEHVRIAAMWNDVESESGVYDFSTVDWMMDTAGFAGAKVVLVVGQKAPRWPECHIPEWVDERGPEQMRSDLLGYVRAVVERYKDHPALENWQVENEPFIRFEFGECDGYQHDAIYEEIDIVRELDPDHQIVVTDSGELGLWYHAARAGDILGTTLYRTVQTPGGNTVTYDWVPAGIYKARARLLGKSRENFFVSELQAEPWFTDSDPLTAGIVDQLQPFTVEQLKENMAYAQRVGGDRVYLWGVEWWYWMKQQHIPGYWDTVKEVVRKG